MREPPVRDLGNGWFRKTAPEWTLGVNIVPKWSPPARICAEVRTACMARRDGPCSCTVSPRRPRTSEFFRSSGNSRSHEHVGMPTKRKPPILSTFDKTDVPHCFRPLKFTGRKQRGTLVSQKVGRVPQGAAPCLRFPAGTDGEVHVVVDLPQRAVVLLVLRGGEAAMRVAAGALDEGGAHHGPRHLRGEGLHLRFLVAPRIHALHE